METPHQEEVKTAKVTLKMARCELNESRTLEEAKTRIDELLWLLDTAEKLGV
jgi:hypothetical protein